MKRYIVCWDKDGIRSSHTFDTYEEAVRFSTDRKLYDYERVHMITEPVR